MAFTPDFTSFTQPLPDETGVTNRFAVSTLVARSGYASEFGLWTQATSFFRIRLSPQHLHHRTSNPDPLTLPSRRFRWERTQLKSPMMPLRQLSKTHISHPNMPPTPPTLYLGPRSHPSTTA